MRATLRFPTLLHDVGAVLNLEHVPVVVELGDRVIATGTIGRARLTNGGVAVDVDLDDLERT